MNNISNDLNSRMEEMKKKIMFDISKEQQKNLNKEIEKVEKKIKNVAD